MRTSWMMSVRRSGWLMELGDGGGEERTTWLRPAKRSERRGLLKKRREALPHHPTAVSLDQKLINRILSDKRDQFIEATTQIRTLLCGEMFNVRVEEVIQAGLVPRFVELLTCDDFSQLQFEAAWALTNIASGTSENTEVVIGHGAVAILVRPLSSPFDGVLEQVVWALGNISGDPPRCRDIVLGHGALPSLLLQLNHGAKLSMLVNAAWTLSNLCKPRNQKLFSEKEKLRLRLGLHLMHSRFGITEFNHDLGIDLDERIRKQQEEEEEQKRQRREKKKEKKKGKVMDEEPEVDPEVAEMMGFGGFGSSKKS